MPRDLEVDVRRSRRKTLAIEVTGAQTVVVRAPQTMPSSTIRRIIAERRDWIDRACTRLAEREAANGPRPSAEDLAEMRELAKADLSARVERWSAVVGVQPKAVQLRNQRTRWGSCSTTGTISFNIQLMRLPEWVRDYVVVHELAHLVHPNHGAAFWAVVARVYPRYREARAHLREAVLFR